MDKIQIEARLEEMPKEIQQEMRMIRQNSDDSGRSLPYKYEIKNVMPSAVVMDGKVIRGNLP